MKSRRIFMVWLIMVLAFMGCGRGTSSYSNEEAKIRSRTQEFVEAFNAKDSNKLASFWAEDALYINPLTGETAEGRQAIAEYYRNKFSAGKNAHLTVTINSVEIPEEDWAIEKGQLQLTSDDELPIQSAFKAEYRKENGQWVLDQIGEIEIEEAPSQFDHLKELSWLIGKWVDEDGNIAIKFDNQWDKYKNFITQHFTMKIFDHDSIEGRQIIGWDPTGKKIRSWVFDSDGGFGEGDWLKEGQSWHAKMAYTLSDGSRASATLVYTPVDKNTYTFSSEDREVDGEILPSIDPVKVVRE